MRSIKFLTSSAALCAMLAAPAHAAGSQAVNSSDLPMTAAQAQSIEASIFELSKRYPQVAGNVARMSAECVAAHQYTGMCRVFIDLVRQHHFKNPAAQHV